MNDEIPTTKQPEVNTAQHNISEAEPAVASAQRTERLEDTLTKLESQQNGITPERAEEIKAEIRRKYPTYEYNIIPSWMVSENPTPPEPLSPPEYLIKRGEKEPWQMTREEFEKEAPLFHGTTKDFEGPPVVVPTVGTSHTGSFASTSRKEAEIHAYGSVKEGRVIPLAIRPDAKLIREQDIPNHLKMGQERFQWLQDNGYDGELFEPPAYKKDEGTVVVGVKDDIYMDHRMLVQKAIKDKKMVPDEVKKQYRRSLASRIVQPIKAISRSMR